MHRHLIGFIAVALSLLVSPMAAAQSVRRSIPELTHTTIARGLARADSSLRQRQRRSLAGAAIGAVSGATLGFGLAWLGHRIACEGPVECAARPTRAMRTSMLTFAPIGCLLGAAIGWSTGTAARSSSAR
jgi:hypothetical protein